MFFFSVFLKASRSSGAVCVWVCVGGLCEVLQGLAHTHAGPVEGPAQGEQDQQEQKGPGGVDPLVVLGLEPCAGHQPCRGDAKEQA